jgi:hypothetical protein
MFLLSHQAYNARRIPGLNANSAVFVCLPTTVILPVHSVCKLFSTVAAVSCEPAASPMPSSVALLIHQLALRDSKRRLAKTCRPLQASKN